MNHEEVDYLASFEGANFLAEQIRKYWQRKGYEPSVWVEKIGHRATGDGTAYCVRSDMIGGLPRG